MKSVLFIVIPYTVESLAYLTECHESYIDANNMYVYTLATYTLTVTPYRLIRLAPQQYAFTYVVS